MPEVERGATRYLVAQECDGAPGQGNIHKKRRNYFLECFGCGGLCRLVNPRRGVEVPGFARLTAAVALCSAPVDKSGRLDIFASLTKCGPRNVFGAST